nr:MAG TPA: hypothetical protein [Caudoviricetes sp.]
MGVHISLNLIYCLSSRWLYATPWIKSWDRFPALIRW